MKIKHAHKWTALKHVKKHVNDCLITYDPLERGWVWEKKKTKKKVMITAMKHMH